MKKLKKGKTRNKVKILSVVFSAILVLVVLISLPLILDNKNLLFKDKEETVTYKTEAEGDTQNQVSTASYVEGLTIAQDENGAWYCSLNGEIYYDYNGVVYYENNWFYVNNGWLDWEYTGVAYSGFDGNWYYIEKGVLNWNYTGLAHSGYDDNWYYIKNGALDWAYTGFVDYDNSTFYVINGH